MGSRGNAGFPAVQWGHAGDSPRGEKIADFPGQLSRLVILSSPLESARKNRDLVRMAGQGFLVIRLLDLEDYFVSLARLAHKIKDSL